MKNCSGDYSRQKILRARAAAVRVFRYAGHQIELQPHLLLQAAGDEHGRVRLEALVAASWLGKERGMPIVAEAGKHELDDWMIHAYSSALARLNGNTTTAELQPAEEINTKLNGHSFFLCKGNGNLLQGWILQYLPSI